MENLNEEVNRIKHLFNFKNGDVITESMVNEEIDDLTDRIPMVYGLTYDIKLFKNTKDVTDYVDKELINYGNLTDIYINFPTKKMGIKINNIGRDDLDDVGGGLEGDVHDNFTLKFIPIDSNKLDNKQKRRLKKIYKEHGIDIPKGEFPILNPTTLPSFRIFEKDKDGKSLGIYEKETGEVFPYEEYEMGDYELYDGEQFNVYVKINVEFAYDWL